MKRCHLLGFVVLGFAPGPHHPRLIRTFHPGSVERYEMSVTTQESGPDSVHPFRTESFIRILDHILFTDKSSDTRIQRSIKVYTRESESNSREKGRSHLSQSTAEMILAGWRGDNLVVGSKRSPLMKELCDLINLASAAPRPDYPLEVGDKWPVKLPPVRYEGLRFIPFEVVWSYIQPPSSETGQNWHVVSLEDFTVELGQFDVGNAPTMAHVFFTAGSELSSKDGSVIRSDEDYTIELLAKRPGSDLPALVKAQRVFCSLKRVGR